MVELNQGSLVEIPGWKDQTKEIEYKLKRIYINCPGSRNNIP